MELKELLPDNNRFQSYKMSMSLKYHEEYSRFHFHHLHRMVAFDQFLP